jgi:hypothetical protein
MVQRAQPFPKAPPGIKERRVELFVPVKFSLR